MEYFHTDWAAMTLNDWIGLIVTISIFCLMIWAYVYVFHPKNREKLESQRHIPLDDDAGEENPHPPSARSDGSPLSPKGRG